MLGVMKRLALLLTGLLLLAALSACATLGNAAAKRFGIGLEPDEIDIAAGASGQVEISIKPLTGVDLAPAEAIVTLRNAPAGISAEELTIPAFVADTLTVNVASSVALTPEGEPLEVKVRAVRDGTGAETTLKINVLASDTP